jgi:hypothetical protein
LSVGNGVAYEEPNGRYVDYEDFKAVTAELAAAQQAVSEGATELLTEAVRLITMATRRYPLPFTDKQCRDAYAWLADQHRSSLVP